MNQPNRRSRDKVMGWWPLIVFAVATTAGAAEIKTTQISHGKQIEKLEQALIKQINYRAEQQRELGGIDANIRTLIHQNQLIQAHLRDIKKNGIK